MIEMDHFKEKHLRKDSTRPIVEHLPWSGTRTSKQRGKCSFTAHSPLRSPLTTTSGIRLCGQPANTIG
jgi:hypothetical protein